MPLHGPNALKTLNRPKTAHAERTEHSTEHGAHASDGDEPIRRVLEIIDEIHAEQAGDHGARREAQRVDGDAGLEEHDLVALHGQAGAEGVLLLAQRVDDAGGRLDQRVRGLVVRLEHVLGLLVVGGGVAPPRERVRQVHARQVLVRVEHVADRVAHAPRLLLDLAERARAFEDRVQRDRPRARRVQPQRLCRELGFGARRHERAVDVGQHGHEGCFDGAQFVGQFGQRARFEHRAGHAPLEVAVDCLALKFGFLDALLTIIIFFFFSFFTLMRLIIRDAPTVRPRNVIDQQRLIGLNDHRQVEELQQNGTRPYEDPRRAFAFQIDLAQVAVPQLELLRDLRFREMSAVRVQAAQVVEVHAGDFVVFGAGDVDAAGAGAGAGSGDGGCGGCWCGRRGFAWCA